MIDPDLLAWVRSRLPGPPATLLEIGAGSGELAASLRTTGYEVTAIDPGAGSPGVERIALAELDRGASRYDTAVAVVSLHHVEPLAGSLETLAAVIRPGGALLVDEVDFEAFDERAAAWLIERRGHAEALADPAALVAEVRGHMRTVSEVRAGLAAAGFELEPVVRGAYLHRWNLPPGHGPDERRRIEAGELPAVGARFAAVRR